MLPHADSVLRTLMPAVLDAAGMGAAASKLRSFGPVESLEDAVEACALLSAVRDLADLASDGWEALVEEAAFWSEAAIRSASEGDQAVFGFCVGRVRAQMDAAALLIRIH
jgi:hypothetical protein